jgi:SOS-response transcriptional repressor LexA
MTDDKLRRYVYEAVVIFWNTENYGPSLRDIQGILFQWTDPKTVSTSTIKRYLEELQAQGMIKMDPFVSRSVRPSSLRIKYVYETM